MTKMTLKNIGTVIFATLLVTALSAKAVQAVPTLHNFILEDADSLPVFLGTVTVDSSQLTPNTFIAFEDLTSLTLTIGSLFFDASDATNQVVEGVITDATGELLSFHDSLGELIVFENGIQTITIRESNGFWNITATGSGPSHSFQRLSSIPEPSGLLVILIGLLGLTFTRYRRVTGTISNTLS